MSKPTAEDLVLARFLRVPTNDPIENDAAMIAEHRRVYAERACDTLRGERDRAEAEVAKLNAELSALRDDTTLLDWLEAEHDLINQIEPPGCFGGAGWALFWDEDAAPRLPYAGLHPTARAMLRSAREALRKVREAERL